MTGLTNQQQGYITLIAEVLQSVSIVSIPSTLQGSLPAWVPLILFLSGAISKGLMQFAGASPQVQQSVIDSLKAAGPYIQKYAGMTPDQQKGILALLELEAGALKPTM